MALYTEQQMGLQQPESAMRYEAYSNKEELLSALDNVYTDSGELVDVMGRVGSTLPQYGLGHLVAFNTSYLCLSEEVRDTVKRGAADEEMLDGKLRFQYPDVVEKTMGIFAELYFRQIREHLIGKPQLVDEAWRPLFYGKSGRDGPPGVQFLLGMNAHIVYDLPQALMKSGVTESYYDDYTDTVGLLIDQVAKKLSPALVPGTDGMREFFVDQVVKRIADWRDYAWHAGRRLQATMAREGHAAEPEGHVVLDIPRGRLAAKAIMRECKKRALRNARVIGTAGRAALRGATLRGGEPPLQLTDLLRVTATEEPLAA